MRDYAHRHGYELWCTPPPLRLRPPSWLKVSALLDALEDYDEALWLDCDIVICDPSGDLGAELEADSIQALVAHHTPDGEVPNCGVWYVRREMRPWLEHLWTLDRYLHHGWWEQAGMLDLLGYRHPPARLEDPSALYRRTTWLGLEWNSHEQNDRHPAPRFAHATAGSVDWREQVMRDHLARARAPLEREAS